MLVPNLPIPLCGKRDKRGAQQRQEGLCCCRCVCVCVCVCVYVSVCLSVCVSWAQAGQMQLARTHSQARSLANASATLHPCLPGATSQVETPPGCPHPTGRFSQNKPTLRRPKVQALFPSITLFAPPPTPLAALLYRQSQCQGLSRAFARFSQPSLPLFT